MDHYVSGGSTVNVCLLDLSKAYDKMNHFGLYGGAEFASNGN